MNSPTKENSMSEISAALDGLEIKADIALAMIGGTSREQAELLVYTRRIKQLVTELHDILQDITLRE